MSDDFASLVAKLNQMSTIQSLGREEENNKPVEEPKDSMHDILSKMNEATEDSHIASKGNIAISMTESYDDGYNFDILIDKDVVASGKYDGVDKVFTVEGDDFMSTDQILDAFANTAEDEGHEFKETEEPIKEGTPDENYVQEMFTKAQATVNTLEKIFRTDGLMARKIDAIGGDMAVLKDIQEGLSGAYEALEDGHYGAMAHIVTDSKLKQELEDYKHEYTPEDKADESK